MNKANIALRYWETLVKLSWLKGDDKLWLYAIGEWNYHAGLVEEQKKGIVG